MARVVLITTGKMEERALGASLQRIFPEHEFVSKVRLDGFTSAALPPDPVALRGKPPINLDKFANTLIGSFAPGGREDRPRADFVVGFEDVELLNAHDPGRITQSLRDRLVHNLNTGPLSGPTRARAAEGLADRCSFHLLAPMTEAYFFADPAAFARATASTLDHPCLFDPAKCDIESFSVVDRAYTDPATRPKRDRTENDWRCDGRHRHPKHYLYYLTDAKLDGDPRYDELKLGVPALAALDWPLVARSDPNRTPAVARFARSLLADLADMLGTLPLGMTTEDLEHKDCHSLTWPPPAGHVLRNL